MGTTHAGLPAVPNQNIPHGGITRRPQDSFRQVVVTRTQSRDAYNVRDKDWLSLGVRLLRFVDPPPSNVTKDGSYCDIGGL